MRFVNIEFLQKDFGSSFIPKDVKSFGEFSHFQGVKFFDFNAADTSILALFRMV